MKGRIFLVHWNASEAEEYAATLRAEGWEVETEAEDGARAGKRIKASSPDAVVIYLARLPSHVRERAHALRQAKASRDIPVIFVGGTQEAIEKTKAPDGEYVGEGEVLYTLKGVINEARRR